MTIIPTAKEAKKVSDHSDESRRIKRAAFKVVDNLKEEISINIMKAAKRGLYKTNFRVYTRELNISYKANEENIDVDLLAGIIINDIDEMLVKLGYKVIYIEFPGPKIKVEEFGYKYKNFDYLDISVSWEDEKEDE